MADKQSSDERLLKLIEGQGTVSKRPSFIPPEGKKQGGVYSALKFKLLELKPKFKGFKINLFILNKGLIAVAVFLTLVFLYTLFSGAAISNSSALFAPADTSAIMKLISAEKDQGLIRKSILSQDIAGNFFLPFGSRVRESAQEEIPDMSEELKNLKLVGIIWSKNPEIMVENTRDGRTHTYKKGDTIDTNIIIKDISRNSATLEVGTDSGQREFVLR